MSSSTVYRRRDRSRSRSRKREREREGGDRINRRPQWNRVPRFRHTMEPRGHADGTDVWVYTVGESKRPKNFNSSDFDYYEYILELERSCATLEDVERLWFHTKRARSSARPSAKPRVEQKKEEEKPFQRREEVVGGDADEEGYYSA